MSRRDSSVANVAGLCSDTRTRATITIGKIEIATPSSRIYPNNRLHIFILLGGDDDNYRCRLENLNTELAETAFEIPPPLAKNKVYGLEATGRPSRFAFIFCGPTRVHLVQFLGVSTKQSQFFGISKIKGKSREIRANLGASEFGFITFGAPSLAHHICFELCRAYPRPAGHR